MGPRPTLPFNPGPVRRAAITPEAMVYEQKLKELRPHVEQFGKLIAYIQRGIDSKIPSFEKHKPTLVQFLRLHDTAMGKGNPPLATLLTVEQKIKELNAKYPTLPKQQPQQQPQPKTEPPKPTIIKPPPKPPTVPKPEPINLVEDTPTKPVIPPVAKPPNTVTPIPIPIPTKPVVVPVPANPEKKPTTTAPVPIATSAKIDTPDEREVLERFCTLYQRSKNPKLFEDIFSTVRSGVVGQEPDITHKVESTPKNNEQAFWFSTDSPSQPQRKRSRNDFVNGFIPSTERVSCEDSKELKPLKKVKKCNFDGQSHIDSEYNQLNYIIQWDNDLNLLQPRTSLFDGSKYLTLSTEDQSHLLQISFCPPPKTTLLSDPHVPYLPEVGAHVVTASREHLEGHTFPRNLQNKIELYKKNYARSSLVENEIQNMQQRFQIVRIQQDTDTELLECTCVKQTSPPILLKITRHYPEQPAEYTFSKEYELGHFSPIKVHFERTILSENNTSFTIPYLLCTFETTLSAL